MLGLTPAAGRVVLKKVGVGLWVTGCLPGGVIPRFDRSVEINRIKAGGLVVGLAGVALVVGRVGPVDQGTQA